jgi:hypothetical protein
MIRRNTWILLLLLAALVGFSLYVRGLKAQQTAFATPTAGSASLFGPGEGSPTDVKIESALGTSVEVARDQSGTWVLKAPVEASANQGSAEAAATQIGALRVLANVQLGPDVVGLDRPAYTLTVACGSAKTHKLTVGSVTPIQNGYYVQLDGGQIQVTDKGGLDALLDLLTRPPYLATLTPIASSTPTLGPATPTPQGTPTPLSPQSAPGTPTP